MIVVGAFLACSGLIAPFVRTVSMVDIFNYLIGSDDVTTLFKTPSYFFSFVKRHQVEPDTGRI